MKQWPSYRELHESGELRRRADEARAALGRCRVCPRACDVDRLADERATCHTGRRARVSTWYPHFGEELALRGHRGSGTIFFGACNLQCFFCQNHEISQAAASREVDADELADMMLSLQERGCHNINWVSPEHVVPQALDALELAAERGLRLPIVYNTSGYDSLETLRWLDGVVDIYLPDFKVWEPETGRRYLKAADYPSVARAAIREMARQVGPLRCDSHGLATRGLMVRHLVMPGLAAEAEAIFRWLAAEIGPDTWTHVMDQYTPLHRSDRRPEIDREVSSDEWRAAISAARRAGLQRFEGISPAPTNAPP
ncbi:MAG: radical SAM protein [Deltaproteobacteria bacterium]|nr:radical SAM protein [Deltaproteobacteria bacterium]MCB9786023.1 radical SAM protein [Deltaproteobacteria bacterium]